MRVLHVLDHSIPLHSGYTFRTAAILRGQRALGIETHHLTSPKHTAPFEPVQTIDGLTFHRTPAATGWMTRFPVAREWALMGATTARLLEVAREVKPDVLHAHSPVLNAIPALRVGHALGLPVVYEVRAFWEDAAVDHGTAREGSPRYRATRALETYAFRRVDHVTTICEGLRADIVARAIPASAVTVIPNAVDVAEFSMAGAADAALQQSLGLAGASVVGFIGSFYAYEGLSLLLDALPQLAALVPNVRILLVGGGPEDARLRARAAEPALKDRVIFTGRVPHDQVGRYYDLIDVLAYPRLAMRLTELVTPLKPLEAMAQGRLLVASDVGGHKELIDDGRTGTLFRAGDPGALAQAITGVLRHRESWPERRAAARAFVETERTWARSVARYPAVYAAAIAHARARVG